MPGIVTASDSPGACGHRVLTILLDGEVFTRHLHEDEAAKPLSTEEKETLIDLEIRRRRANQGWLLAGLAGKAVVGDESSNVKQYDFLGPGSAVVKTNIGAAYVNVCPGLNGERVLVDCTGCTEFRIVLNANLIGTGQWGARVVRDSDNTVLFEQANLGAAGERELDTGWQPLPAWAAGLEVLRLQMKSQTAADDPVVRRCTLLAR